MCVIVSGLEILLPLRRWESGCQRLARPGWLSTLPECIFSFEMMSKLKAFCKVEVGRILCQELMILWEHYIIIIILKTVGREIDNGPRENRSQQRSSMREKVSSKNIGLKISWSDIVLSRNWFDNFIYNWKGFFLQFYLLQRKIIVRQPKIIYELFNLKAFFWHSFFSESLAFCRSGM
jgi:hypothetical protein